MTNERLTPRDYEDAINVQDACNLSGVVHAFSRVMGTICNESNFLGMGTEWKNRHPIAILYASKIASLTACDALHGDGLGFSHAYDACLAETLRPITQQAG